MHAATTGIGNVKTFSSNSAPCVTSACMGSVPDVMIDRSKPAENRPGRPCNSTAVAPSASALANASLIARSTSGEYALAFPSSTEMTATAPSRANETVMRRATYSPLMRGLKAVLIAGGLATFVACGGNSGSSGSSATSVEAFCAQSAADESIFSAAGPGATDSSQALAAFEDLTAKAPPDIKADMTTILTFLRTSSSGTPDAEQAAAVTTASQRVVQFFKDKCHVDLAGSTAQSFSAVASSISN